MSDDDTKQEQLFDLGPAGRREDRRREGDVYLTPTWATSVLLERCAELRGFDVLDPCCGDGRMAVQLLAAGRFREVRLNDIAPPEHAASWVIASRKDAADPDVYLPAPDWVVTNPPFNAAGDIARVALQRARMGVALLLRATWLEPCGATKKSPRAGRSWLPRTPPTRIICLPRISFTGDGKSDSAAAWWMIWLRQGGAWQRGGIEVAGRDVGQLGLEVGGAGGLEVTDAG